MRNLFERILLVIILILLIIIVWFLLRCCPCSKIAPPLPPKYGWVHVPLDSTQLVVWVDPSTSPNRIHIWIDSVQRLYGNLNIKAVCATCDSSLLLLDGPGAANFINTETTCSQSKPKDCHPNGDDGGVYWSANFPMNYVDVDSNNIPAVNDTPAHSFTASQGQAIIAVFDTGVDPDENILTNHFYTASGDIVSCKGLDGNAGWNFFDNTKKWSDDYSGPQLNHHGTVVAAFTANQEREYGNNQIKILPVKIHDSKGRSNLFNVLCGLAYAQKMGANIVNASFGFYAAKNIYGENGDVVPDQSADLFKAYVKYYLTDKGIILVASAGNADDNEKYVYSSNNPDDMRNLDNVCFYPASFSSELWNVIAVTTINHSSVSPHQNYSKDVVDVGVIADRDNDYVFQNPIKTNSCVVGTSFAAPIITGKIAANYSKVQTVLPSKSKDAIWRALGNNVSITSTGFNNFIVNGRTATKHAP